MRKNIFLLLIAATLMIFVSACSNTETSKDGASADSVDFPNKPITIIVNTSPGSSVDVMARTIAKIGEKYSDQPIVVENKQGGDGAIAMSYVLNQPDDGHTVWAGTKTLVGALNTTLTHYTVDSFQPVIRIQDDPFALGVRADSPFNTLEDVINYASENPGEIKIGGFGSTSAHTLAAYQFMHSTGVEMTWVPFDAGSDGITNALGGHIDISHSNPSSFKQFVESGDLKILGIAAEERIEDFPDVPTYKEQGVDIVDSQWRGLFVKGGTSDEVVTKLHDIFKSVIDDPEFVEYMVNTNQYFGYMDPKEFYESIVKEYKTAKGIVEKVDFDY